MYSLHCSCKVQIPQHIKIPFLKCAITQAVYTSKVMFMLKRFKDKMFFFFSTLLERVPPMILLFSAFKQLQTSQKISEGSLTISIYICIYVYIHNCADWPCHCDFYCTCVKHINVRNKVLTELCVCLNIRALSGYTWET